MANLFRGEIEPLQVFPFPDSLNPDQKEMIGSLIDPVTKFFVRWNLFFQPVAYMNFLKIY